MVKMNSDNSSIEVDDSLLDEGLDMSSSFQSQSPDGLLNIFAF